MFRKWHLTGIIVLAVLLVAAVAGVAIAGSNPQAGVERGNSYHDFIAKFAANLGVDQDKVTAALEATKKQMLDEAVQKGNITQEQADKIAAQKNGNFGWFGGLHGKKQNPGDRGNKFNFMRKGVESILGITSGQLKAELKSGKNLEQIISDHGLTTEQFHQKMLDNQKEALAKAVSDGKLTQEQADKIIKKMEQSAPTTQRPPGKAGGFVID